MSKLEVLKVPNKILYNISQEIRSIDDSIRKLMSNMLETMYLEDGIGLAAPQIGINKRIIVIDLQDEEIGNRPFLMANPKIIKKSDELISFEEGCLSVPDQKLTIQRPKEVSVEYIDYSGKLIKIDADGLFSICIQHEIDHLDGITILESCKTFK